MQIKIMSFKTNHNPPNEIMIMKHARYGHQMQ